MGRQTGFLKKQSLKALVSGLTSCRVLTLRIKWSHLCVVWSVRHSRMLLLGLPKSLGLGDKQTFINCCFPVPGPFKAMEQFSFPLRNIKDRRK